MELIKILLEQSTDYSNWNTTKPADFSTSKYDVKTQVVNGRVVISYKLKSSTGTPLSDYVGQYKITSPAAATSVRVEIINDGNKLSIKYGNLVDEELTPGTNNDEFTFEYSGRNIITFKRDSNSKVNGFNATVFNQNVVGEKAGSSSSTVTPTPAPTGTNTPTPTPTPAVNNQSPTVVQYTKYDVVTPEERLEGFKWHDCENKDFPFEFGCKNTYIGQMNECIFGKELNGVFGSNLWESMKDLGFNEPKKEITKKMYDMVMLNCKKQEESIKRKKIIKENTYKILKQLK